MRAASAKSWMALTSSTLRTSASSRRAVSNRASGDDEGVSRTSSVVVMTLRLVVGLSVTETEKAQASAGSRRPQPPTTTVGVAQPAVLESDRERGCRQSEVAEPAGHQDGRRCPGAIQALRHPA